MNNLKLNRVFWWNTIVFSVAITKYGYELLTEDYQIYANNTWNFLANQFSALILSFIFQNFPVCLCS